MIQRLVWYGFVAAVLAHTCLAFSVGGAGQTRATSPVTPHSSFELSTTLSISSLSSGDLETAQINIDKHDSNSKAQFELGVSFRKQNNLTSAVLCFRRAIELEPNNRDAKYQLGDVLTTMGYIDEAVSILRDLVSEEEATSQARPSQAKIAFANVLIDGCGQRFEALEIYRQCCAHGPSPMALLAGVAADSMGDHATAEEFYKSGLKSKILEEADPDTALHLMMSRLRVGDKESVAKLRCRLPEHTLSSADYILSTSVKLEPSMHYFTYDMLQLALENSSIEGGLILEFGVYHGKTIRMIASHFRNDIVHGFDTFTGIPEAWHLTPSGSYSTQGCLPESPDNVKYHVGLFSETLPGFLESYPGPIRLMNIDCDLYSSTKDVLDATWSRVVPGTIVIFDEYVMNPHWKEDEYRAFQKAVAKYGWKYEYIAISLVSQQAVVRII